MEINQSSLWQNTVIGMIIFYILIIISGVSTSYFFGMIIPISKIVTLSQATPVK